MNLVGQHQRESRGLFNRYTGTKEGREFRLGSWSARALLCYDLRKTQRKINFLWKLASQVGILCLQEVHGTLEEIQRQFFHFHNDYYIFPSPSATRGTGGVLTMVKKAILDPDFDKFDGNFENGNFPRIFVTVL